MTEELAPSDAYQRECRAVVAGVLPGGVLLDRTVFYPRGGGQPGDTGLLEWAGGTAVGAARIGRAERAPSAGPPPEGAASSGGTETEWAKPATHPLRSVVSDTVREQGEVVHVVAAGEAPPVGAAVLAVLDWERRHLLMRTHTALHVLSALVWGQYGANVTGGNMEPGQARMDFELEAMSVSFGREVEERLNAMLSESHPVRVLFLPRAEALADPDLIRTKVSLIPEHVDPIRVVDIAGLDRQADGGTHVADTLEVGRVRVTGTESKGKGNKRMRIALDP